MRWLKQDIWPIELKRKPRHIKKSDNKDRSKKRRRPKVAIVNGIYFPLSVAME